MTQKNFTPFCLLGSISSTEDFLEETFHCSTSRLKKFFDKSFLNRSYEAHQCLDLPLNFTNDGLINPVYDGPEIETLFEDDLFLVLKKPPNLFVHPLSYEEKNNCLSFLRKTKAALLEVNRQKYDRGLLYRLDFETSGVLVYVKEEEAYHFLREHFKTLAKKKIYHCLVEGDCKLSGEFTHYFSSGEKKGKRVLISNEGIAPGTLILRPQKFIPEVNVTMMEVELIHGLRHQIRAQLAHLGFPIRGDKFYGGNEASRMYLNASLYEIKFGEKDYSFKCDPQDFNGL